MEGFKNNAQKELSKQLYTVLAKSCTVITEEFKKVKETYSPTDFFEMLRKTPNDGVTATLSLISSKGISGFDKLRIKELLELSVEAIVISEDFRGLFEDYPEIISKCEHRLRACECDLNQFKKLSPLLLK